MKILNRNINGITLIALVVSIILLLILAGVSIGILTGDNGLFGRTQKAVKNYDTSSEKETLTLSVANYNISLDEADKLGEKLSKKDVSNPDWHMIQDEENTYADGWYFVKQGDELPNGNNAKNNWVINYGTGEVKQLNEKYASMSLGDSVAVKDGLVLNIDTAMMDKKEGNWTKSEIEKALGDNVTLNNFEKQDLGTASGFNSEGFLFDGENDYISIKNSTILDDFFNNGFTFEFSGVCKGSFRDFEDNQFDLHHTDRCCLFSFGNSNILEVGSALAFNRLDRGIYFMCSGNNKIFSEWSDYDYGCNIVIPKEMEIGEPINFSIVLDLSEIGNTINIRRRQL